MMNAIRDGQSPVEMGLFSGELTSFRKSSSFPGGVCVDTLVTVEKSNGRTHLCFTHDPENESTSPCKAMRPLAQEVLAELNEMTSARSLTELARCLFMKKDFLEIDKTDFYVYLPPGDRANESFWKVDLAWKNGRFISDTWTRLDHVPGAIRDEFEHHRAKSRDAGFQPESPRL